MSIQKEFRQIQRSVKMEVFGEEYDLTPEEAKEVREWYEKNKHHANEFTEKSQPSGLDLEMALVELGGNTDWHCTLAGSEKKITFYEKIHPLGGNMAVEDAVKDFGVSRATGFRWLKELKKANPDTYDLDKWPTKDQLDAYRLVHPEMGGLTQEDAAKLLGINQPALSQRLDRMRERFPGAFSFERMAEPIVFEYDPEEHDELIKRKF